MSMTKIWTGEKKKKQMTTALWEITGKVRKVFSEMLE